MTESSTTTPITFFIAWTIFIFGLLCTTALFFVEAAYPIVKAMALIGTALLSIGVGEILNHPKEVIFTPENDKKKSKELYRRRRNVCGLGNLFLIIGLLLFFMGLSSLIYRR